MQANFGGFDIDETPYLCARFLREALIVGSQFFIIFYSHHRCTYALLYNDYKLVRLHSIACCMI